MLPLFTPAEVAALCGAGCEVLVQSGAGTMAGFEDPQYAAAGARIAGSMEEIYAECDETQAVRHRLLNFTSRAGKLSGVIVVCRNESLKMALHP